MQEQLVNTHLSENPIASIDSTFDEMVDLFEAQREQLESEVYNRYRVPLLVAPPGNAKDAVVLMLRDYIRDTYFPKHDMTCGIRIHELRMSCTDSLAIEGIPIKHINGRTSQEYTKFIPPMDYPILGDADSADGDFVIIFLNELAQASLSNQAGIAQLLDGKVGNSKLDPYRTFIVMATNDITHFAASNPIPTHIKNRSCIIHCLVTPQEWQMWASNNKVSPHVISFIEANSDQLNQTLTQANLTQCTNFPSPRSWAAVGQTIDRYFSKHKKIDTKRLKLSLSGYIGGKTANQFLAFIDSIETDIDIIQFREGKLKPLKDFEAGKGGSDEKTKVFYLLLNFGLYFKSRVNYIADTVSKETGTILKPDYIFPFTITMYKGNTKDTVTKSVHWTGPKGFIALQEELNTPAITPEFKALYDAYYEFFKSNEGTYIKNMFAWLYDNLKDHPEHSVLFKKCFEKSFGCSQVTAERVFEVISTMKQLKEYSDIMNDSPELYKTLTGVGTVTNRELDDISTKLTTLIPN